MLLNFQKIVHKHKEVLDKTLSGIMSRLLTIKLSSKSKAESEFFRIYFRSHLADDLSQSEGRDSDFTKIGKDFHRWIMENEIKLGLTSSDKFVEFVENAWIISLKSMKKLINFSREEMLKNFCTLL